MSWSYSGKWTPIDVVNDGEWLGGLAHDDLDPRVPGTELYTAGKRGHLFQVTTPTNERMLDARRIGGIEGREIHTLVAGDLDAAHPGHELLLFTNPGGLYMATPTGPDGTFEIRSATNDDSGNRYEIAASPRVGLGAVRSWSWADRIDGSGASLGVRSNRLLRISPPGFTVVWTLM